MLIAPEPQSIDEWKHSLNTYQRSKRTKRPFGKAPPQPQPNLKPQVQQKEMRFNPVLQSFRDEREMSRTIEHEQIQRANQQLKHIKNNYQHNVDYDIINFAPALALPPRYNSLSLPPDTRKKEYKDPTYYPFNIIDGTNYDDQYLNNRSLRHQKYYQRKIHPHTNPYNIISGTYSNVIDQTRDEGSLDTSSLRHSIASQQYDPIYGRFCNPEDEQKYQRKIRQSQQPTKLPPSYLNRQSLTLGQTAPASPIVQNLDAKKEKAKQRYKLRYRLQDEQQTRGRFEADLKEVMAKNRVHEGRIQQERAREFNILNSKQYEEKRAQTLFGKQITGRVYDLRPYAQKQTNRSPIKHSGFTTAQQS